MDNHPIPQDVTGFQFKLIGAMTVKQFGYVAFGVIMAVILYYLPFKEPFGTLIKVIFIPLLGGSGFAIAFFPIEGRPVDVMLGNFLKSLFTPNQYVYHKSARALSFNALSKTQSVSKSTRPLIAIQRDKEQKLQALLQSAHDQQVNPLDARENAFLQSLVTPQVVQVHPTRQLQTPQSVASQNTSDKLEQQKEFLTKQLEEAKKEETTQKQPAAQSAAHQKVTMLEKQILALQNQKQHIDQELTKLQSQLASKQGSIQTQPAMQAPIIARALPNEQMRRAGLPHVPDVPNVVVGIVKDPRGNVLPNMLVEVKDKDGNPVRAFKTNMLGQFASATPLAVGLYTIELEDPKKQHTFTAIQIDANNQIMQPIEVMSQDAREELRKALFN